MSSAVVLTHLPDPSSSFREDAPRPPVPGEEGEAPCPQLASSFLPKSQSFKAMPVPPAPRRNENGLGEPEGSASPDSPLARWTKSLHSLLGDQDGAYLFRTFLEREKCVDTLDFWFACNGFRQMDLKDTKTLRVAKAIYKRYIENNSIVSKQLKPATKTYIRDSIKKQQIDSIMFDQAQTEIQTVMEENAYQMFLTSDIYLEYVRSGGENPAYMNSNGLGSLKVVCGYLPTLNEEEEWSCADFKNKILPSVVGLSSKTLRVTANVRATETIENGYRSFKRNDPINPYHVNSGYVFAPATSANDSEISSDALTDDSMSMTDSSVDGIPPYRIGSKKQLQREMHRSVKANGQVSLPHFPFVFLFPTCPPPLHFRCSTSNQQRDRNHSAAVQGGNTPFCNASLMTEDHKEPKKPPVVHTSQCSELVVTYFFCGEEIPYRRMLKAQSLTLGHFKEQLSKKGNYRYYFKKASDEFDCGAVFEEIWEDETILPMYEGRILGKVERID
ncbi:axin-2 [Athene cunicularia]|uniref:axin-2 n=1 Tax=Athene cunicularia TaxID=194338 RepID=UPI000EF73A43|nr:axin-2 [Athene cunicularia]